MKRVCLLAISIAFATTLFSQRWTDNRYTVSGGLLGGINMTSLRVEGDNLADFSYEFKPGWSVGAFVNFPLNQYFSFEPQVMYSVYNYNATNGLPLIPYGKASYISIPLLFKLHDRNTWALTFGPQFDLLNKLDDGPSDLLKDDIASTSLGVTVGLEILPRGPVTIYGRYTHGITSLDENSRFNDAEFFNSNIQAGVKLRLFGKVIPIDTDNDGIPDKTDKCPTVAGLATMEGCPDSDSDGITDASDNCPQVAGVARYQGCPIPDTDNDGVNDEVDKCPKQAGVVKYNGCPIPDTDADGINDEDDKCPSQAGIAKYNGCPIPDTDGDGVNDENDKCPTTKGLAEFSGCPNPDKDNDGVPDAQDLCPSIKGPKENDGCPIVENAVFNAKMIQFVTGKADLTAQAKKDIKEGAKLINSADFKNFKIEIQGHTDSDGSDEYNHKLSHRRADSVKAELVKNGVDGDRLTTIGFGEEKPIADNGTAAGKALNRRVVLKARE